jgi:hypothetical protein
MADLIDRSNMIERMKNYESPVVTKWIGRGET